MTPHIPILTAALCMIAAVHSTAGILKCVDEDGKIYFSDVACPEHTRREFVPGYKAEGQRNFTSPDPRGTRNSVIEQTRRMDALRYREPPRSTGVARTPMRAPEAVRADLQKIDRRLEQLDSREESMRDILRKNVTDSRRDWTYRKLDEIREERRDLYRDRVDALSGSR
ncbi:MAG: DUF4124 domain-containing protein [Thiohalocapsa sp.]|nr:DUF4124 domain-containing protein [Thiohalocapsa sp.]